MKPYSAQTFGWSPLLVAVHPPSWETLLARLLNDPTRRLLIFFVAHRLTIRLSHPDCVDLRLLLADYVYELQPGSGESCLPGASETELARVDALLTKELAGAIEEVANATAGDAAHALRRLATAVVEGSSAQEPDRVVERWVRLSREARVPNPAFLQLYVDERMFVLGADDLVRQPH